MKISKSIILCLLCYSSLFSSSYLTPSDVYAEVIQIQKELIILKKHFNIINKISYFKIKTPLKPRHAWQKTYEIMLKINILRLSHNMPVLEPSAMAPVLNLDPALTFEQTQRILTEIRIFKHRLLINAKVSEKQKFSNKTPLDVYNALNKASVVLDILNGGEFTPSHVFGETMRIFDDISTILAYLNINNHTIPTKRRDDSSPFDTFNVGINILSRIEQIQKTFAIESINFYSFKKNKITPSDVFSLTQLILAELQTIKAYIGLDDYVTPYSKHYKNKTPADVDQMMGWSLRQISLISLDSNRKGK